MLACATTVILSVCIIGCGGDSDSVESRMDAVALLDQQFIAQQISVDEFLSQVDEIMAGIDVADFIKYLEEVTGNEYDPTASMLGLVKVSRSLPMVAMDIEQIPVAMDSSEWLEAFYTFFVTAGKGVLPPSSSVPLTIIEVANSDMFITLSHVLVLRHLKDAWFSNDITVEDYGRLQNVQCNNPFEAERQLMVLLDIPVPSWLQAASGAEIRETTPITPTEEETATDSDDGDTREYYGPWERWEEYGNYIMYRQCKRMTMGADWSTTEYWVELQDGRTIWSGTESYVNCTATLNWETCDWEDSCEPLQTININDLRDALNSACQ